MIEAVAKYTGQNFEGVTDVETARKMADAIHVEYEPTFGVGKIINACFDEYVEDKLIQPVFITGHPKVNFSAQPRAIRIIRKLPTV